MIFDILIICHDPREKTDIPEYKKNADFIADLFKKFPLGRRKRRNPETPDPTQSAGSLPTTASCIEPYEEDDRCDMDPPPAVDDSEEDIYTRYFYNTNNGECQPIRVADATLTGNVFATVTRCQRTCSKHHSRLPTVSTTLLRVHAYKLADRPTDRQTDRQTDRRMDGWTGRQTATGRTGESRFLNYVLELTGGLNACGVCVVR